MCDEKHTSHSTGSNPIPRRSAVKVLSLDLDNQLGDGAEMMYTQFIIKCTNRKEPPLNLSFLLYAIDCVSSTKTDLQTLERNRKLSYVITVIRSNIIVAPYYKCSGMYCDWQKRDIS
jgi:hypothetical protein